MTDTGPEDGSSDDREEPISIKDSDAVVETDDGKTVLEMESLQKGGGDVDAILDQSADEE